MICKALQGIIQDNRQTWHASVWMPNSMQKIRLPKTTFFYNSPKIRTENYNLYVVGIDL